MKYQFQKQLCSLENERPISFSYTIWFMISEKPYHKVRVSSPWCMYCTKSLKEAHKKFFETLIKLPLWGLGVFKKCINLHVKMYLLTEEGACIAPKVSKEEGRSFKRLLRENFAIALDSCYFFTKKMLNMELNMTSTYRDIRQSWNLQQIWWITCNLSSWWIWQSVSL